MGTDPGGGPELRVALTLSGMTLAGLWLRYVGLGGTATAPEVAAYLDGREGAPFHHGLEHDTLVQALNERFMEMDLDHPVPYQRG